jgi:hypothetical protein
VVELCRHEQYDYDEARCMLIHCMKFEVEKHRCCSISSKFREFNVILMPHPFPFTPVILAFFPISRSLPWLLPPLSSLLPFPLLLSILFPIPVPHLTSFRLHFRIMYTRNFFLTSFRIPLGKSFPISLTTSLLTSFPSSYPTSLAISLLTSLPTSHPVSHFSFPLSNFSFPVVIQVKFCYSVDVKMGKNKITIFGQFYPYFNRGLERPLYNHRGPLSF